MKFRNTALFVIIFASILLTILPVNAAAATCIISITSIPDDALVRIDGMQRGSTPFSTSVPCGNHTIEVQKSGYVSYFSHPVLADGEYLKVDANLEYKSGAGSVLIISQPPGGALYIDGKSFGPTPVLADNLLYGRHTILIKKAGYADYRDIVTAGPDGVLEYTEYLVPEPYSGYLGVSSSPDGGDVFLDGDFFGTTPTRLEQVPSGNHTVLILKEGYRNYTKGVTVHGAESLQFHADLQEIPCTGNLVIDTVPSGAEVYFNGTFKALAPAVFESVPEGNYSLTFRMRNFPETNFAVTINGGETSELLVRLANGSAEKGTFYETVYSEISNTTQILPGMPDDVPSIDRTYTWYTNGHEATVNLRMPRDLYDYYLGLPHERGGQYLPGYVITDNDRIHLHNLIGMLKDAGESKTYAARNDYRNVVSFVQAIEYTSDLDPATSEKTDYWQYPVETLVKASGDCEDHAILAGALLKELGYDVALVLLEDPTKGHAAVAVACDGCNGYYYPIDGKKYYFLETTGYNSPLGVMDEYYEKVGAEVFVL